jgi:hypothetical protein
MSEMSLWTERANEAAAAGWWNASMKVPPLWSAALEKM